MDAAMDDFLEAVKDAIYDAGGGFMSARATYVGGKELGLRGFDYYFIARGGVLGDVDPAVISATMVFFPRAFVDQHWAAGRAVLTPPAGAAHFAEACYAYGRQHFSSFQGAERLAGLAEKVADAVDPAGMPLFAGWCAMPRAADAPARLAMALDVLREHRGGAHNIAVLAAGLTPVEAIVGSRFGAINARFFGWPEPYPDAAPTADRRAQAEKTTNAMIAPAYAALDAAERAEFVDLCAAAHKLVQGG